MSKISKRIYNIRKKIKTSNIYDIDHALLMLKKNIPTKFIESVDVAINLKIDPRKPEQNIRGTIQLPHGIGRIIKVAVFAKGKLAEEAYLANADFIGMEDLAHKIKNEQLSFDIVIASYDSMNIVNQLGQILGPRGLMPNHKLGTITNNIKNAIDIAKNGQIFFRNDKNGIIHSTIGKINFDNYKLKENLETLLLHIKKMKPSSSKGNFFKKISISTTMGIGITINHTEL